MTEREHQELISFLESDQLASARSRPVGLARLGHRARLGLWALRVLALAMSAMVIYTFIAQLGS